MKKKYIKKLYKVEIDWIDSLSEKKPWHSLSEIENYQPKDYMKSIGFLIHKGKKFIIICMSLHFEDEYPTTGGLIFSIPVGCIRKIKYLEKFI